MVPVHGTSVSRATATTGLTHTSYSGGLQSPLLRYGALNATSQDIIAGAKIKKKLVSVHGTSVSRATATTGWTNTSYSCGLQSPLLRYGALNATSQDIIVGAKIKKKSWRLFTGGPFRAPPPQQDRRIRPIVAVCNTPCHDTVP